MGQSGGRRDAGERHEPREQRDQRRRRANVRLAVILALVAIGVFLLMLFKGAPA